MGAGTAEGAGAAHYYFDPVIKCCTYIPELHNFLVGRILTDNDPSAQTGRATVQKRIADQIGVTPLGLAQPPVFALLYHRSEQSFGRSRTLRCPHYIEEGGRCGVWRHRDSTCATWFCKHVRGNLGHAFWQESLHRLLSAIERDLARWCILEMHPTDELLEQLAGTAAWTSSTEKVTGESLNNMVSPETYARLWGEWHGRETEFFDGCADLVNRLSWADVLAISGPGVQVYARLTKQAYHRLMSSDLPPALKVGSMQLVRIQHGLTRINTYSSYDPLDVPQVVMEVLPYFDGRPTNAALSSIEEERGVRLDLDLVRKMADFGLLIPAAPNAKQNP